MSNPNDKEDAFAETMALDIDDVAAASPGIGGIDPNAPAPDATIPMSADEAQAFLAQIEAEQARQSAGERLSSTGTPIAPTLAERAVPSPPPANVTGPAAPHQGARPAGAAPSPGAPVQAADSGSKLLIAAIAVVALLIIGAVIAFAALL